MLKDHPVARSTRSSARRLGRRAGVLAFAALVSVPTLVWSYEIMESLFFPPPGPVPASCHSGLKALLKGIDRARRAAREPSDGERERIERFRAALGPEWAFRPALDHLCKAGTGDREHLRQIDALRYAEEHAVRYEATALASQRLWARELERELETQ